MSDRTAGQITNDYIETTQIAWKRYVNGLQKLWGEMKDKINLPSHGVDVYSSKAEAFWLEFKNATQSEFNAYKEALQNL